MKGRERERKGKEGRKDWDGGMIMIPQYCNGHCCIAHEEIYESANRN